MRNNYGDECLLNSCIVIGGELLQCYENGDIVIPPMTEKIKCDENNGYTAFQECKISSLIIPKSLMEIRPNTFSEETEPVKINYNGTKNEWEAIQGKANLLSNISMNSTVSCRDGDWKIPEVLVEYKVITACLDKKAKSLKIPEGAEILLEYSFEDLPMLQSLTLPESILTIDNYAAVNCPALKEVFIPSGINFQQIPQHAFKAHTHVKKHIYNW